MKNVDGFKILLTVYSCILVYDFAARGCGKGVWSVICAGHQSPWTLGVKWNERWQQSPAGLSLGRGPSQASVSEGHTLTDEVTRSLGMQTQ